jgi:hypothetical protein
MNSTPSLLPWILIQISFSIRESCNSQSCSTLQTLRLSILFKKIRAREGNLLIKSIRDQFWNSNSNFGSGLAVNRPLPLRLATPGSHASAAVTTISRPCLPLWPTCRDLLQNASREHPTVSRRALPSIIPCRYGMSSRALCTRFLPPLRCTEPPVAAIIPLLEWMSSLIEDDSLLILTQPYDWWYKRN